MPSVTQLAWVAFLLVLAAPSVGQACAVCAGGAEEEVRSAFIATTGFLTFAPLLMIGGAIFWFRRRFKEMEAAEQDPSLAAGATILIQGREA